VRRALLIKPGIGELGVEVRDLETPPPGASEARVEMAFAPINPADLLLIDGRHVYDPVLPSPIGIEGAGVVVAVGERVDPALVGRRVAVPYGGTWSQAVVLSAEDLIVVPDDVELAQAAMLAVNPITAAGLLDGVEPGQVVLQDAAASAVGRLVVRIARRRGIRTVNIVRREAQVEPLRALGAEVVLVGDHDLPARVRAAIGDAPVVRALDAVAGAAAGALFSAVSDGGTLVVYGLLAEDRVLLPASGLVFRDVTVRGYTRLRTMRTMAPGPKAAMIGELVALLQAGTLASEIEATYPLARVRDALAHHARPGRSGKILLELQA